MAYRKATIKKASPLMKDIILAFNEIERAQKKIKRFIDQEVKAEASLKQADEKLVSEPVPFPESGTALFAEIS